ncbi:hypothetical protein IMZ11_31065 [Microtetraspora sp. AC03309]|uniref:hypothetical protein n=1 Tax=Microtetraspora sp. AC03309 TaxID=2779376 RepID=UPI001E2E2590|nr:hypothetical protein [Microtetraspora sp. AC03309]MCC5580074.1 hypothetical protein [Microtetraspora sp. AC03309]
MKPDRRMLISAGVVTAIVVGGVSVATTASAGRLEQAVKVRTVKEPAKGRATPSASPVAPADDQTIEPEELIENIAPYVVENHLSIDPGATGDYWTTERLQGADPMPMPQVSISVITPSN